MKPPANLFVCEFITGGGFNHIALNEALAYQGRLMRDALLRDLSQLSCHVSTTVDARLSPPENCHNCTVIDAEDNVWQVWEEAIKLADAVWLIAPESDGFLAQLTTLAVRHKKQIFGCGLDSIKACSSKVATYQVLKKAGIATIETYASLSWTSVSDCKWLAKPDDGAGCEDTVCFDSAESLRAWVAAHNKMQTHVVQPYLLGTPASISCVMHRGEAQLLSCNTQLITLEDNMLHYEGCVVNGLRDAWVTFEQLAIAIAQALPSLMGYVGIDVIVTEEGSVTVIEINPRLTTSYVALAEATGANPAELIMNTLTQENDHWPTIERNEMTVHVGKHHA